MCTIECVKMGIWMRTLIFSLLQIGLMNGTHAREAKNERLIREREWIWKYFGLASCLLPLHTIFYLFTSFFLSFFSFISLVFNLSLLSLFCWISSIFFLHLSSYFTLLFLSESRVIVSARVCVCVCQSSKSVAFFSYVPLLGIRLYRFGAYTFISSTT